jgi:hypothetical protein
MNHPTFYRKVLIKDWFNDALPINVKSLLMHLCRYDEETYEHLLDWLAAVLQLREPLRTAWIFTGVQGTGKNICMS